MNKSQPLLNRIFLKDFPERNQQTALGYSLFRSLSRRSEMALGITIGLVLVVIQHGLPTLQLALQLFLVFLWFVPQFLELSLPPEKLIPYPLVFFWFFQCGLIEAILLLGNFNLTAYFFISLILRIVRYCGDKVGLVAVLSLGGLLAVQFYFIVGNLENYWFNLFNWTVIVGVIYNRRITATRERINRRRTEQLLHELEISHEQLKQYAMQVEQLAATQERNRIARDIHDSLGHLLMAISVQLEKAMIIFPHEPEKAYQTIEDTRRLAGEALQEVRRSVSTLRSREETPTIGSDAAVFDINEALQKLAAQMQNNGQFEFEVSIQGSANGFDNQALITLYRVAQEGLTNIQKYAQAKRVQLSLEFWPESARLLISDNGKGFAVADLQNLQANRLGGYGLQGLRERLQLIGGRFEIESQLGNGTRLLATVPKIVNVVSAYNS